MLVKYGRQHWLIAGYNTMPEEKKKNVDIEGLAGFMGNLFLALGVFVLAGTLLSMRFPNLFLAVILLYTAAIFYLVIKAQQYDHNKKETTQTNKKRLMVILTLVFSGLIVSGTFGMLLYGQLSPAIETDLEGVVISGLYGTAVSWEEITGISLENEIPKITTRNNGLGLGEIRKGHFTVEGKGRGRLYLESDKGPFLCITTAESFIIINYKDPAATATLYRILSQTMPD